MERVNILRGQSVELFNAVRVLTVMFSMLIFLH
jgi:hypothetical protein